MTYIWHPKKKKRKRTHGFLKRMKKPWGRKVLQKRREKKRKQLTV
ncbi:MAG: 50S ribosomal protein L34 [Parcubacteria group bacterium CG_4_9_14_0_2_um_filter_35_11]|nr:MAG: 50S ribosomal protein L34 [Parcubacteria group bacterium CG07_land_8_20_14_0_80_35_11]PJC48046.1 MAG: 50S ribosomal protein L34 [Parcubacteria group bacterium CG_4_9_14_0_2_um_filter_35_11]